MASLPSLVGAHTILGGQGVSSMHLFTLDDFKVFDIRGFNERMAAILTRIRPKLTSIGE